MSFLDVALDHKAFARTDNTFSIKELATTASDKFSKLCRLGLPCHPTSKYDSWTREGISEEMGLHEIVLPEQLALNADPFEATKRVIQAYSDLRDDWDGYGASAFGKDAIDDAIIFLNRIPKNILPPEVSPSGDNEVVMEWEDNDFELVISFYGDHKLYGYIELDGRDVFFESNVLIDPLPERLIEILSTFA